MRVGQGHGGVQRGEAAGEGLGAAAEAEGPRCSGRGAVESRRGCGATVEVHGEQAGLTGHGAEGAHTAGGRPRGGGAQGAEGPVVEGHGGPVGQGGSLGMEGPVGPG